VQWERESDGCGSPRGRGKSDFLSFDLPDAESARELVRKAIELGNARVDILIASDAYFLFREAD